MLWSEKYSAEKTDISHILTIFLQQTNEAIIWTIQTENTKDPNLSKVTSYWFTRNKCLKKNKFGIGSKLLSCQLWNFTFFPKLAKRKIQRWTYKLSKIDLVVFFLFCPVIFLYHLHTTKNCIHFHCRGWKTKPKSPARGLTLSLHQENFRGCENTMGGFFDTTMDGCVYNSTW